MSRQDTWTITRGPRRGPRRVSDRRCGPVKHNAGEETNLCPRVVVMLLVGSRVHHMDNVIDGDGGLGNVGGKDDFPLVP